MEECHNSRLRGMFGSYRQNVNVITTVAAFSKIKLKHKVCIAYSH